MARARLAAAALAFAVVCAHCALAARVGSADAAKAAEAFLSTKLGKSELPGRAVASVAGRGNIWIVSLSPSGHVKVPASDKIVPVASFTADDFAEPVAGSIDEALLAAMDEAVRAAEADESRPRHFKWKKILGRTAATGKAAILAKASLYGESGGSDGSGEAATLPEINIAPFATSHYHQNHPWNLLSPMVDSSETGPYRGRSLNGCVSTADAALMRHLRWPVYVSRVSEKTHNFRGGSFTIRFDGSEPLLWDLMRDDYINGYGYLLASLTEDELYSVGRVCMWLNHCANMTYSAGESTSTKNIAVYGGENDWYTAGRSLETTNETAVAIVTNALSSGIPVYVGVKGHATVCDGWKTEDGAYYAAILKGYGGAEEWHALDEAWLRYFWVEHYPRGKAQLDPLPRVVGSSVDISWHFPDCHTNSLYGFAIKATRSTSSSVVDWTADFSDDATGSAFPSNVWGTCVFSDGAVALDGAETQTGFYQFSTPLAVTADSVLSLDLCGGVNSGNVDVEICGDDGNWRVLATPACAWQYWPGAWTASSLSLADWAGQTVQLRIAKKNVQYNGRIDIKNFKVSNVVPLEGDSTLKIVTADARSATVPGLVAGADYAFTVTPMLADGALVQAEPSDAKIAIAGGTHVIPGSISETTVDRTVDCDSIAFSDSLKTTAGTAFTCKWRADCENSGWVSMRAVFIPADGGEETVLYTSGYKVNIGEVVGTGDYEETFSIPEALAGVPGTLAAEVFPYFEEYLASYPSYSAYCDIGDSAIVSLSASNLTSTSAAETETLEAADLPEFESITYSSNGARPAALTDGRTASGSIGSSKLYVKCSEGVTELAAFPSHLEYVADDMVHVKKNGGSGLWEITFDPAITVVRARQRMILTLRAKDANGSIAHRDVMMRMLADEGIEGGAEDLFGDIYEPCARPAAVWNMDFDISPARGAVTLDLQGNEVSSDGKSIRQVSGANGIDFAVSSGGGSSALAIALMEGVAAPQSDYSAILSLSTGATNCFAALSITSDSSFRFNDGLASGQWYTKGSNTASFPAGAACSVAFKSDAAGVCAWTNGASAWSKNTIKTGETSVLTDVVAGGWRDTPSYSTPGASLRQIAIFTDAAADSNDVKNWSFADMVDSVTFTSQGGTIASGGTFSDCGINLHGGEVALEGTAYAAGLFVQDDTTLVVPQDGGIDGSRVLYVAPGKKLTVDCPWDADALTNRVSSSNGVYSVRILRGANYGDIEAGTLPDVGEGYRARLVQDDAKGVYLEVADALRIYNDSGAEAGYYEDGGATAVVTNFESSVIIRDWVENVRFVYDGSDVTGAFVQPSAGSVAALALDPAGAVDGVNTKPEPAIVLDAASGAAELDFESIAGLWYAVGYADAPGMADAATTEPKRAEATGARMTLSAPAGVERRFYRVDVAPSKTGFSQ